jgi:glycosyltransferase involved in cell wall biosynthesis
MSPKLTIGIPFYNNAETLGDAIRSVFAQTFHDWELILVDDGSTDHSLEIASSIKDSRVRVISDGQNRKLPYRLNQITREAQADFIARMDADDLISPLRFEKQLAILDNHPEIDLVTTGVCSITNDTRPVGLRCGSSAEPITGRKLLLGQCAVVHAAMLGRKSWFVRNPYDETAMLTEDYELWLRAFANKDFRVQILNEPLYYYREENNATAEKLLKAYRNQVGLIKKYGYLGFNSCGVALVITRFSCKSLVVRGLDLLHKTHLLLKKRNIPITDEALLNHFNLEIEMIQKTTLPR